ncbi:hypothetical protein Bca4012_055515 [Brassica carinata]
MLMSMSHCGGSMLLLVAVFLVLLESSTSLISSPSSIINPSKVKQVSSKPRAFVYEGFLTDLECDHLISLAKENLQRSAVADNDNGESQVSDVRTSSGTFISKGKDPIVSGIEDKLSTWTFLPKETVFPDAVESSRRKLSVNKDDLSECAKKGIAVKPRKGDALLFFNLHEDATPDTLSLHGGCPVIEGEKWSATKWIHVDSFDKIVTHDGNCTDVNESCERWAVLGECAKNPEYMVGTPELPGNCRRSCKAC